jgi:hypothetical protein
MVGGSARILSGIWQRLSLPPKLDAGRERHCFAQEASGDTHIELGDTHIELLDAKTLQVSTLPDSKGLVAPILSPKGRYLVATALNGQKLTLYDFAKHAWSELLHSIVGFTEWSRDGRYVYFDSGVAREASAAQAASHGGLKQKASTAALEPFPFWYVGTIAEVPEN